MKMFNWRKPIVYFGLKLSGSKILDNLKTIQKIDGFSCEEKIKYQEDKLKKILLHAYKNVSYYKKVFGQKKVVKNGEVDLKNFDKIPVLTKDVIRKEKENLYSKDYKGRNFYKNSSGGSTGEPVQFIQDKNYSDWNIANKIFIKLKAGQEIGEKELRFWGSERDLLEGKESLKIRLRNWIYNRKEFNTFRMSEKEMFEYVEGWNRFRPDWVESYVQSIYEFALFVEKNKLKIYSPKNGILTSAGNLYPDMKKTIEKVFNCKVYNRYGSREIGDAAYGNDSLQLSFWNHKLELSDKRGNILATTLNNYSMPLIRYEIGDMAVQGKSQLEFEKIIGRGMEVFKTKEGKIIPGEFFIHFIGVVHNNGSIIRFQAIQKSYRKILMRVVLRNKENFRKIKKDIERSIRKEMGKEILIEWDETKEILPTKSGKYLYTISEIK